MTEYVPNERNRRPTHPGAILREDVFPSLRIKYGFTITDIAERLGMSRQQLHRIMSGDSAITIDIAYRLGRFVGPSHGLWLGMQSACDMWDYEHSEDYKNLDKIWPADSDV